MNETDQNIQWQELISHDDKEKMVHRCETCFFGALQTAAYEFL